MKKWLKAGAELTLGSRPSLAAIQVVRPIEGVIFAYHNVVTPSEPTFGDRSLHLPLDQFIEQIRWLKKRFEIVRLDELFENDGHGRPRAVITFDDAYMGAVRHALPFLIDQGIPATIFVCSGWTGGEVAWWDSLVTTDGLAESFRNAALTDCAGQGYSVIELARRRGIQMADVPDDYRIAKISDVDRLAQNPTIDIGMHSHTHANLCMLNDLELHEELASSIRETRAQYSQTVNWLAYPYGLMDDRVASAAQEMGFSGALLISGGPMKKISRYNRFTIPRVNIPNGLSAAGFKVRSVGLR